MLSFVYVLLESSCHVYGFLFFVFYSSNLSLFPALTIQFHWLSYLACIATHLRCFVLIFFHLYESMPHIHTHTNDFMGYFVLIKF